ncbi:aminopeptidase P family protein, partial [bacterium]
MNPLDQARIALAETPHGEAMLITSPATVRWLTGFSGSFGLALIGANRAIFVTDSRYKLQAATEVQGFEVESFASPVTAKTFLAELVKSLGLGSLGFEASHLTYAAVEEYRTVLGVEFVPVKDVLSPLRMVKSEEEIAKIRRACELTDVCFTHLQRMFTIGTTEYDLGLELEFFLRRHRAGIAFDPIVASGPNSAKPHGRASERKLEAGDFLTLDFGATLDGYNSDLTRTVVIGEPTPRHAEVYGQVLKAQLAAMAAMLPG